MVREISLTWPLCGCLSGKVWGDVVSVTTLAESATVPYGLDKVKSNGNPILWDENTDNPQLYTGQVDSLFHDVENGKDEFGHDDMSTHAYWAKDHEGTERFYVAEQAATQHIYKEILDLWSKTEGNEKLRAMFSMSKQEKISNGILYELGVGSAINIGSGDGCPAYPFWHDQDQQIEYISDYVKDRNKDEGRKFRELELPE